MWKPATLTLLLAALTFAAPQSDGQTEVELKCGNPAPSAEGLAFIDNLAMQEEQNTGNVTAQAAIQIRVFYHVVAASQNLNDGWVTDAMLNNQFTVLNNNFKGHDITFVRAGTTRTVNANWANNNNNAAMRNQLRKGTYKDLNIYVQKSLGSAAGLGALPREVSGPASYVDDGVQIIFNSLPGSPQGPLYKGKVAVHEVGHWMGLLHTFQGGCEAPGDMIGDTPAEASPPQQACPTGRDSCPGKPGKDPIHNHMDYTSADCRTKFTPGQVKRMNTQWNAYRKGH